MVSIYGKADIFVSTPNVDNMPMSLLEAFAVGLPVVSTNVGGVPYLITEGVTGLMIPPDNHEALATAIARIVRDPEFGAQLTHNARTEIEHKYVWDAVRPLWLSVYQATNESGGTRPIP
jgi:L-malate glycosyltransferase